MKKQVWKFGAFGEGVGLKNYGKVWRQKVSAPKCKESRQSAPMRTLEFAIFSRFLTQDEIWEGKKNEA